MKTPQQPVSKAPSSAPQLAKDQAPERIAMVALRHPRSKLTAAMLMGLYFLATFSLVSGALAFLFLLTRPIGVGVDDPRGNLHLWTVGIIANIAFLLNARWTVKGLGGLDAALAGDPTQTWILLAGSVLSLGLLVWHITWAPGTLSQMRRKAS